LNKRILVGSILACFAVMLAIPAVPAVFATTPFTFNLSPGSCSVVLTFPPDSLESCSVPATGANTLTPYAVGTYSVSGTVQEILPAGPSVSFGPVACCSGIPISFPTRGVYLIIVCFYGPSAACVRTSPIDVGFVFVAPQFPLGAVLAIVAPLSALGLYVVARKRLFPI